MQSCWKQKISHWSYKEKFSENLETDEREGGIHANLETDHNIRDGSGVDTWIIIQPCKAFWGQSYTMFLRRLLKLIQKILNNQHKRIKKQ